MYSYEAQTSGYVHIFEIRRHRTRAPRSRSRSERGRSHHGRGRACRALPGKDAALVTLTEKFTADVIGPVAALAPRDRHLFRRLRAHRPCGGEGARHPRREHARRRHHRHRQNRDAAHARLGRRAPEGERLLKERSGAVGAACSSSGASSTASGSAYGAGQDRTGDRKRARAFDMEIDYYNRRRCSAARRTGRDLS